MSPVCWPTNPEQQCLVIRALGGELHRKKGPGPRDSWAGGRGVRRPGMDGKIWIIIWEFIEVNFNAYLFSINLRVFDVSDWARIGFACCSKVFWFLKPPDPPLHSHCLQCVSRGHTHTHTLCSYTCSSYTLTFIYQTLLSKATCKWEMWQQTFIQSIIQSI